MKKVCVDEDKCIGCGACVAIASNVFKFNDEGHSTAINSEIKDEDLNDAKDAASSCPVDAIEIK